MSSRGTRALRGTIAAAVSTFTAAASHGVADGQIAGLFAVIVAFTASVFVCIALAGRSLSRGRIALSVVLSQLAYHALFAFAPGGAVTATGATGPHAAHAGGSITLTASAVAHSHGAGMWLAHVLAAIVTVAALTRGEHAIRSVREALRLALSVLLVLPNPVAIPRTRSLVTDAAAPRPARIALSSRPLRGPPVLAVG
ncbi:hypothetical protein SAMN04489806_1888 [Paramicrobacterium humi]|uniref:Uncharacterized protein n=1 Tax=Paramicrobacterium humi TaxID=640635 RepID=A0A1H4MIM5_9MICO|nr:hypothetical protein [Microbacterium humi]SEB82970.1 hypothetical protein SAMN04489806_1888 [Microbacterium humi]